MNQGTSKLYRKFAAEMGQDITKPEGRAFYQAMKRRHSDAPSPLKAKSTAEIRKQLASEPSA